MFCLHSVLLRVYSKPMHIGIAILLLLDFWVSCRSNSDAKPDFDLIWAEYSVILLFFSKTMKKRGVVKTRNAGISRNMAECHGIWRNITENHDNFPEYTGTSQYFPMVAMRLFINMDVWQLISYYKSDGSFTFWR
jgi:hypothetical protein